MELDKLQNEVMGKIGQNVLCFQRLELMLKHLIPRSNIKGGTLDDFRQKLEKEKNNVTNKTLGQLIGQYIDKLHLTPDANLASNSPDDTSLFSLSFTITMEEEVFNKRKQGLARLVDTRNNLIHHFISQHDLSTENSCHKAIGQLDEQHVQVKNELDFLESCIKDMKEAL